MARARPVSGRWVCRAMVPGLLEGGGAVRARLMWRTLAAILALGTLGAVAIPVGSSTPDLVSAAPYTSLAAFIVPPGLGAESGRPAVPLAHQGCDAPTSRAAAAACLFSSHTPLQPLLAQTSSLPDCRTPGTPDACSSQERAPPVPRA
jgi:hypothetical protein